MLISSDSSAKIKGLLVTQKEVFCSGLFLSARWFVLSNVANKGVHLVVLPTQESAEYCSADLYSLVEGDRVFFLPSSGRKIERSNYKSSLGVQRTAAIGKVVSYSGNDPLFIVSYPEALSELIPDSSTLKSSIFTLKSGEEVSYESVKEALFKAEFEKVDFVSAPGQFAVRGSIIDIFSYSFNDPYRVSFFGDEIEEISVFDCNTQLSKEKVDSMDIISNTVSQDNEGGKPFTDILPKGTIVWLDSSDMYSNQEFFGGLERFSRVYIDSPISHKEVPDVMFKISPQPSFNKNFELLTEDIRARIESGYRVYIYGEKETQLERLRTIFFQNGGLMPEFVNGKNIHNGFIDNENRVCCYSDHEIFDRFHRVTMRRTVEKSEQLTINDLNAINMISKKGNP